MEEYLDSSAEAFAYEILPMYFGPMVKLQIKNSDIKFTASKSILCHYSSYFRAMFEGNFTEAKNQTACFEPVEGVVSKSSIEGLLKWLYPGKVIFETSEPDEMINKAIEQARLADMCDIAQMGPPISQYIASVTISVSKPDVMSDKNTDLNARVLNSHHIYAAGYLPQGHAVRWVIACASVEGFMKHRNFKFAREAREHPSFGADLLYEVQLALDTMASDGAPVTIDDPLSTETCRINSGDSWYPF